MLATSGSTAMRRPVAARQRKFQAVAAGAGRGNGAFELERSKRLATKTAKISTTENETNDKHVAKTGGAPEPAAKRVRQCLSAPELQVFGNASSNTAPINGIEGLDGVGPGAD